MKTLSSILILFFLSALLYFGYKLSRITPIGTIDELQKMKFSLNRDEIDKIVIRKSAIEENKTFELTNKQINSFIEQWNKAKCIGWRKAMSKYYLHIQYKNGETYRLNINQYPKIGEVVFKIRDKHFFDNVWQELSNE